MERKARFEKFLDGRVSLYGLDERRKPVLIQGGLWFADRVVGARRNYEAEQAGYTIQRLIRIPKTDIDAAGLFAVIGTQQYKVNQAQLIRDTCPKCLQLTLSQPDFLLDFDSEEAAKSGRY